MARIKAVCFDVGETLVDESRLWDSWADWLGVERAEFQRELRATIARRESHRLVFQQFRPGFDLALERIAREEGGYPPDVFHADDLYPDARDCLAQLHADGYRIAIAGNQPAAAESVLHEMGVDIDVIASSERWGIEKPSPLFFERLTNELGTAPNETAYVGDRIDNDVLPALNAGMCAIFLERGPWGAVHAQWPEAARASAHIHDLGDLHAVLRGISK
jgi:HAD superfamily hydrolase (TIGR01662 family)